MGDATNKRQFATHSDVKAVDLLRIVEPWSFAVEQDRAELCWLYDGTQARSSYIDMVNWGRFMLIKSTNVLSQPTLMSIRAKQSTLESPFKVKRAVIPGNLSRDFE